MTELAPETAPGVRGVRDACPVEAGGTKGDLRRRARYFHQRGISPLVHVGASLAPLIPLLVVVESRVGTVYPLLSSW